jgi:hypothetical protein
MSIPLDRLYHYIENVTTDIRGGNVLIYRFFPHGSKKFKDLRQTKYHSWLDTRIAPQVICYDQEPLNYEFYQHIDFERERDPSNQGISITDYFNQDGVEYPQQNLRTAQLNGIFNVYDQAVLLHSELRSPEVLKYAQDQYVPAYYWSHALLARDWFRYAQHDQSLSYKNPTKTFLIYNRAWSGTREYRLKFSDLLIDYKLIPHCQTACNTHEPETGIHYQQHVFKNPNFCPTNCLDDFYAVTTASSWMSADFEPSDYANTDIEVVLETLFDDPRLHLTEKILRPIACGQPFILAATAGSLEYLRNYGFKTFDGIIDESYDSIQDPVQRLTAIAHCMKSITNWDFNERHEKIKRMQEIAKHNQQHFFSNEFFNHIILELENNLTQALNTVINSNTGQRCLSLRKQLCQYPNIKKSMIQDDMVRNRCDIMQYLKTIRSFF